MHGDLRALGISPTLDASSTDANVPIGLGIPAVCIGIAEGGNAHRLEEFIHSSTIPLASSNCSSSSSPSRDMTPHERTTRRSSGLSPSAARVQEALRRGGFAHQVVELRQTTRSAKEAAEAVGLHRRADRQVARLQGAGDGPAILVIASGPNRVNEAAIAALVGEAIERPDADFVRAQTGFAIGGVPPLGHTTPLTTFIDEDLMKLESIWAAAGTPNAVFPLAPADLVQMTGGRVISVA